MGIRVNAESMHRQLNFGRVRCAPDTALPPARCWQGSCPLTIGGGIGQSPPVHAAAAQALTSAKCKFRFGPKKRATSAPQAACSCCKAYI